MLPIEEAILRAGLSDRADFHGFEMAKRLEAIDNARRLTAHGTLYKALSRMEKTGWLESRWEDPQVAADAGRPLRRLYRVTGAGELALSRLDAERRRQNPGEQGFAIS